MEEYEASETAGGSRRGPHRWSRFSENRRVVVRRFVDAKPDEPAVGD